MSEYEICCATQCRVPQTFSTGPVRRHTWQSCGAVLRMPMTIPAEVSPDRSAPARSPLVVIFGHQGAYRSMRFNAPVPGIWQRWHQRASAPWSASQATLLHKMDIQSQQRHVPSAAARRNSALHAARIAAVTASIDMQRYAGRMPGHCTLSVPCYDSGRQPTPLQCRSPRRLSLHGATANASARRRMVTMVVCSQALASASQLAPRAPRIPVSIHRIVASLRACNRPGGRSCALEGS